MADELRNRPWDQALAEVFPAPAVPRDLRASVFAAIAREPKMDWDQRRSELELEHRRSLKALNARFLQGGRDAFLTATSAVILLGLAVKPLSHWLTPFFAVSAPLMAGLMALGVGAVTLAVILRECLSPPSMEA